MKWFKVWTNDMSAPVLIIKAETVGDAIAAARRENASYACGEEYRQANRCEHYRKENRREPRETLTGKTYYKMITCGVCYAITGAPRCRCAGHKDQCDFFSERRQP